MSPPWRWTAFRDALLEEKAGKWKTGNIAMEEPGRPLFSPGVRGDVVKNVMLTSGGPDVIRAKGHCTSEFSPKSTAQSNQADPS